MQSNFLTSELACKFLSKKEIILCFELSNDLDVDETQLSIYRHILKKLDVKSYDELYSVFNSFLQEH